MDEKAISITYDTLFDLLKREKERSELQKLDTQFFAELVAYMKQKSDLQSPISARQTDNLKKILKEIYDRRERKIVGMAMDKSRTKSNLIDTSALLPEEKIMFDLIVKLFDSFRENLLENVLAEKEPLICNVEIKAMEQRINEPSSQNSDFKSALELKKGAKLVRFVHAVPKFVGTELEEYGPFHEEDITKLPVKIADVLISKGRAEEIKES